MAVGPTPSGNASRHRAQQVDERAVARLVRSGLQDAKQDLALAARQRRKGWELMELMELADGEQARVEQRRCQVTCPGYVIDPQVARLLSKGAVGSGKIFGKRQPVID
jgi:hypothetical protein